jgi:hypothetical protein
MIRRSVAYIDDRDVYTCFEIVRLCDKGPQ